MQNNELHFESGALLDNRTDEEKLKDYRFEETVSSVAPVNWIEKKTWRQFPIFNQNGSGSCVAQTMAKMLGILYWLKNQVYVHFSATHIYQRRSNKPAGGMIGVEAFTIAQKGTTLEVLCPSQGMTDAQMDAIKIEKYKEDVGSVFKIGNFIVDPIKDIETIASIIETTGKPVMVWFYFNHDEWKTVPKILREVDINNSSRHSVCAVDFTLYDGKKALIIDDSWGTSYGKAGQRIITEDFFKVRNFFSAHAMSFKFEETVVPDTEITLFTQTMKFGDRNTQVTLLQKKLQSAGFFPSNISCTGYFGAITKKATIAFQVRYGLVGDGIVGEKTLTKLNEVFK